MDGWMDEWAESTMKVQLAFEHHVGCISSAAASGCRVELSQPLDRRKGVSSVIFMATSSWTFLAPCLVETSLVMAGPGPVCL